MYYVRTVPNYNLPYLCELSNGIPPVISASAITGSEVAHANSSNSL